MDNYDFIRNRIKSKREKLKVTQMEMANELNMDERNYKRIESGERKKLDIDLLDRISKILKMPLEELIQSDKIEITAHDHGIAGFIQTNHFNCDNLNETILEMYKQLLVEFKNIVAKHEETVIPKK